jgi:steroid 5-alpha reductase family enzyme
LSLLEFGRPKINHMNSELSATAMKILQILPFSTSFLESQASDLSNVVNQVTEFYSSSLKYGDYGLATLAFIAAIVTVPLAFVNHHYSDSVGYGYSIFFQGLFLLASFSSEPTWLGNALVIALILYGFRLGSYMLVREWSGYKPWLDKDPVSKTGRLWWSSLLAVMFAMMTSPVLYSLRNPPGPKLQPSLCVAWIGTTIAWIGLVLETVADYQKFRIKLQYQENEKNDDSPRQIFHGPVAGVYRLCRHPNYAGELLFWIGIWTAGLPSFANSMSAWLWATTGLCAVSSVILFVATPHVERQQAQKYSGQFLYENWKREVPSAVFPCGSWRLPSREPERDIGSFYQ